MFNSTITKYNAGDGALVTSNNYDSIKEITKDFILSTLFESGFIVFRGFDTDVQSFSDLVKSVSSNITLDPARTFFADVAQKVDAGEDAVGLHLENGNSPFGLPDLTWFFCEKVGKVQSKFTVCDGVRVLKGFDVDVRQKLVTEDFIFSRNVEVDKWKNYVFHSLNKTKKLEDIGFSDLEDLISDSDRTQVMLKEDKSIFYKYRVPVVRSSIISDKLAFANSLLGPSYNYQKPIIEFSSTGKLITDDMVELMDNVSSKVTEDINWQDGDVLLCDNTRVMHGRRRVNDKEHVVYNALSYI